MSQSNIDCVLSFIQAMSEAKASLAEPCVAPDGFSLAKGYGKFSGRRERDTMVGTIDAFNALIPGGLNTSVKSVTAQDDRVVVEFEGDAVTSEGTPYKNQYCMVFYMTAAEGGQIRQVNEYFCNIHADEVLWPLVEKMMPAN